MQHERALLRLSFSELFLRNFAGACHILCHFLLCGAWAFRSGLAIYDRHMWRSSLLTILNHTPQRAMQRCLTVSKVPSGPLGLAPIRAGLRPPGDQLLWGTDCAVVLNGHCEPRMLSRLDENSNGDVPCPRWMSCLCQGPHPPQHIHWMCSRTLSRCPHTCLYNRLHDGMRPSLILFSAFTDALCDHALVLLPDPTLHCLRAAPASTPFLEYTQVGIHYIYITCRLEGLPCSKALCEAL